MFIYFVPSQRKMCDNVTALKPDPTNWHSSEGIARTFLLEPISLIYVLESVLFFDFFPFIPNSYFQNVYL